VRTLATCRWIAEHQTVIITGPTGTGKSYFGCALAHQACRKCFRAMYRRVPRLFDELRLARADASYPRLLARIAKARTPYGIGARRRTPSWAGVNLGE
jgi:DNA replication protein DnaC